MGISTPRIRILRLLSPRMRRGWRGCCAGLTEPVDNLAAERCDLARPHLLHLRQVLREPAGLARRRRPGVHRRGGLQGEIRLEARPCLRAPSELPAEVQHEAAAAAAAAAAAIE